VPDRGRLFALPVVLGLVARVLLALPGRADLTGRLAALVADRVRFVALPRLGFARVLVRLPRLAMLSSPMLDSGFYYTIRSGPMEGGIRAVPYQTVVTPGISVPPL
jgi:hypothetical protein